MSNPSINLAVGEELARVIVRTLQGAGFVAYFAGGCVRDRLMGRVPKDFDVATSARPEEVQKLFPRSQAVGAAFGVILVRGKRMREWGPEVGTPQVEVATFRADGLYKDGRHPESVRFTNAEEDARRRDFTCNGIFFDPVAETLHDFVGGQADIEAKILRAIGVAEERFAEDHLRMLRAVRFASRMEFAIEGETWRAMEGLQGKIATISRERIGEEMRMMLEHPTRSYAVGLLGEFPVMWGEVFGFGVERAPNESTSVLMGLPVKVGRVVALVALLKDFGPAVGEEEGMVGLLRSRLILSNEETDALRWVLQQQARLEDWEDLTKAQFKRMMAHASWPLLETVYRADPGNREEMFSFNERVESLMDEGVAPAPFVTGNMLIQMGARPGPMFKGWLDQLYDLQLEGELTDEAGAVAKARDLIGGVIGNS